MTTVPNSAAPAEASAPPSPAVAGQPKVWLRLEGLALLAVALAAYPATHFGWGRFALLFLAPDLSFLAYAAGPRVGAAVYNVLHSEVLPLVVLAYAFFTAVPWLIAVSLIWLAHVGFDRALGYGLKYPAGFGHTHLGRVGRRG